MKKDLGWIKVSEATPVEGKRLQVKYKFPNGEQEVIGNGEI